MQEAEPSRERIPTSDDPLHRFLENAPSDDDEGELTDKTLAAIEEGSRDISAGRFVSHEEMKRQLGL